MRSPRRFGGGRVKRTLRGSLSAGRPRPSVHFNLRRMASSERGLWQLDFSEKADKRPSDGDLIIGRHWKEPEKNEARFLGRFNKKNGKVDWLYVSPSKVKRFEPIKSLPFKPEFFTVARMKRTD